MACALPVTGLRSVTCSIAWRLPIGTATSSELALAWLPPGARGEESGGSAQEEAGLMNEMGVLKPPTFEEAVETIRKAGLELPPVPAVTNQLADAAVQLVDNGFFFLARGCIYQMWRTMGNDELGSLNRSLG